MKPIVFRQPDLVHEFEEKRRARRALDGQSRFTARSAREMWPRYRGIAKAAPAYQMPAEELQAHLEEFNPIDRLSSLARASA